MITEVVLLALGETMDSAKLVRWLKREGERVTKGEPVAEIETDKATLELEALSPGVLRKIVEPEGATVPVGKVIAYLADSMDEPLPPARRARGTPALRPAQRGAGVALAQHEAAPLPVGSSAAPGRDRVEETPKSAPKANGRAARPTPGGRIVASPRARRLADREKVDLSAVAGRGSGPQGRIVEADIKQFLVERQSLPASATISAAGSDEAVQDKMIPLAGRRRAIAERMTYSAQTAPHITLQVDVDMSAAETWRARANSLHEASGRVKISPTAVIVKACAWALTRHPYLNAILRGDNVVLRSQVNIGVAVAVEEGLIVPVVHDVPRKGVAEIADEVKALAERAKGNHLKASDLSGGTFTVSNLGMFGVDRFTAILNSPEVGILAVGRIVRRLVPDQNDAPVAKPMLTLTLSADHRVVDGAAAAQFLADLRAGLEDPGLLLL